MKKIKWLNIALLGILMLCGYVVLHDIFMIAIRPLFSGYFMGWTWYGLITFITALTIVKDIANKFIRVMYK